MSLEGLEALRTRFRERAAEDLEVVQAWGSEDFAPSDDIERRVHNLAGAAGTFGFAELHAAAARVDDSLRLGEPVRPDDVAALIEALTQMKRA